MMRALMSIKSSAVDDASGLDILADAVDCFVEVGVATQGGGGQLFAAAAVGTVDQCAGHHDPSAHVGRVWAHVDQTHVGSGQGRQFAGDVEQPDQIQQLARLQAELVVAVGPLRNGSGTAEAVDGNHDRNTRGKGFHQAR